MYRFNFYLKNKGSIEQIKEANIFFSGSNEWRQLPSWPVADMKMQAYLLSDHGNLKAGNKATTVSGYEEYISDPARPVPYISDNYMMKSKPARHYREYMDDDQKFTSRRTDVLVYKTPVLGAKVSKPTPALKLSELCENTSILPPPSLDVTAINALAEAPVCQFANPTEV